MIQILFGDEGHRARCLALGRVNAGSSVVDASGPAYDKKVLQIDTLTFWGHGDAHRFSGMDSLGFVDKVKEWVKWNPTIKTVEIVTCNSRHGTVDSTVTQSGEVETSWVKSFTDHVKPGLKKLDLIVKALPMGMGSIGEHRWSILKFSSATETWLYVTAGGDKDTDSMWPGVHKVEQDPLFKQTQNFVIAGDAVKARDTSRKYTIDYGTIGQLRSALVVLA